MTARSLAVLRSLAAVGTWARPMDVGGTDGSHHSQTLRRLYAAGLVERRPRGTLANRIYQVSGSCAVASWEYRVTEAGVVELRDISC